MNNQLEENGGTLSVATDNDKENAMTRHSISALADFGLAWTLGWLVVVVVDFFIEFGILKRPPGLVVYTALLSMILGALIELVAFTALAWES